MTLLANLDVARLPKPWGRLGAKLRTTGWAVIVFAWLASDPELRAQNGSSEEYQQKASLICNFLRQCKWPSSRFMNAQSPFVVGIQGSDQISEYLRENIQDRLIQNRRVEIRRVSGRDELEICHLVFVSRSERERLRGILGETRRANVLTVGESDNFLANGGVIQFVSSGGQVRYRVSLEAARRERIEPGGFVLRMAIPPSAARSPETRRLAETP